ncbi:MAG: methyltransferase [Bryobacteraceae bacterium]|jgi:HemK-related putative methylase
MNSSATVAVNPIARAFNLLWLYAKRPFLLHRVRRCTVEHVDGVPIVIWRDVLNPVVFRSGELFARAIASEPAAAPPSGSAAPRALDMGAGSGICAIFAARRGYRVTAVDINPEAVRCARINVMLNRMEDSVEVLEGNLFEPLAGRRFDLILFNPPFYRGEPSSRFDMAWRATDVFERFAEGLDDALAAGGRALVLLSTDGDAPGMLRALERKLFRIVPAVRRNYGNEIMTIYTVDRPEDA